MDTDRVFDHVIREHNLGNGNIEEELQIAAKLGQELLLQNASIREKNKLLWQSNEERTHEVEMLRQQNKLLRTEADLKAADQMELENKVSEMQYKMRLLEKELTEVQIRMSRMSRSITETEKLYEDESRRADELAEKVVELEKDLPPSLTMSPVSPLRERRHSNNHLQNVLNRSEDKRRGLEDEISNLLEENCELYKKLKLFEDFHSQHKCNLNNSDAQCDLSGLSTTTLDSTFESECSTLESLTSESWLAEKLSALEERYNTACENCICGACEPISNEKQSGDISHFSYRELFDQLFDAIHSSRIKTPRGTLKRKPKITM